ncbi:hypothetical protein H0H93_001406 [Arthromyces matolae]|nr:hypothetical protein H0H93_001406 [Arthromyces matolae]
MATTPPPAPDAALDPSTYETPRKTPSRPGTQTDDAQAEARINIRNHLEPHLLRSEINTWLSKYIGKVAKRKLGDKTTDEFVDEVLSKLEKKELLDEEGWTDIRASKEDGQNEDAVYRHLVAIFEEAREAAKKIDPSLKSWTTFQETGAVASSPETSAYASKVDFRLFLDDLVDQHVRNTTKPLPASTGRSLRSATLKGSVPLEKKAIFRRRLPTSSTVFIGEVKLVNLRKNTADGRRHLVVLLLFMAFADPRELGIDTTVRRTSVESGSEKLIAYEYDVGDVTYLTQGAPISEETAYDICSRATRVWEVRKIREKGKVVSDNTSYILKDVWLYEDGQLESAILNKIMERLEELGLKEEAKPYFMDILSDWEVMIGNVKDRSHSPPPDSKSAHFTYDKATTAAPLPGSQRTKTSVQDAQRHATPAIVRPELKHHVRKHVRTIYKEVCLSIYEIGNYKIVARVLSDMTEAARYLRLAGYVHRDISAGNCLWDIAGEKGKLSDLEYARPYDELVGHDPRTGTPAFMAAEYLTGSYYLTPRALDGALDGAAPAASQVVAQFKAKEEKIKKASDDPHRTRFNFYHDLESIFWIYIWYLHYRFPKKLMQSNPNLTPLNDSAQKLFLNVIADNRQRTNLIFEEGAAFKLLETLRPIYTPEFRVSLECVAARSLLVHAYKLLEKTIPVGGLWDLAKFDDTYYTLMKAEFEAMIAAMEVEADYEAEALVFDVKRKASTELEEGKANKKKDKKKALFDCELDAFMETQRFEVVILDVMKAEIIMQGKSARITEAPIVRPKLKHHVRKHVRTIYKEVCLSVYEINNYKIAMRVLSDMTEAARYLRLAGYVHRDISAGNCLWDIAGEKGKLSDLEYARPYNMPEGHDPRTGTPAFMAAEYLHGKYELTPRGTATGALSGTDGAMDQDLQDLKKLLQAPGPLADDPHRTMFNFYHDLESIFWIYIWFLHYRLRKKLMQYKPDLPSLQRSAQKLFLNVIAENRARNNLIFEKGASQALYQDLYPIYTPEFEVLLESLVVRAALASAYSELEKTNPVDGLWDEDKFAVQPYTALKERFDRMIAAMKVEADYEAEALVFDVKRKASTELEEGRANKKKDKKK